MCEFLVVMPGYVPLTLKNCFAISISLVDANTITVIWLVVNLLC